MTMKFIVKIILMGELIIIFFLKRFRVPGTYFIKLQPLTLKVVLGIKALRITQK